MRKILLFCEYDEKQNENIHTEIDPYGEEIWEPTKLENYLELLLLLGIKDAVIVNNPEHITFTYSHNYIYIVQGSDDEFRLFNMSTFKMAYLSQCDINELLKKIDSTLK